MRSLALLVLTGLAIAVSASQLAACIGASFSGPPSGDPETLFDESFAFGTEGEIVADLGSMDIDIRTVRSSGARVVVEGWGSGAERFEEARFTATLDGDRLVLQTNPRRSRGWRSSGGLSLIVEVPSDISVNIEIGSGDVEIGAITGAVAIDTGSGDVEAVRIDGAAEVETGSGDVQLGPVGGGLDVSTGSGEVEVELTSSAPASVETGSGDVELALDKGLRFDVSVATGSGDIEIDDALSFDGSVRRQGAEGRIGTGGSPLRVSTGSGSVTIRSR